MTESSTWLPTDEPSSERPDGSGMRLRYRLALVLAFHLVVLASAWWALSPDLGSRAADPGGIPLVGVLVAWAVFLPITLQVPSRVRLGAAVGAFIVCLAAVWMLVPTIEGVYAHTVMTKVDGATAEKVVMLDNEMQRVDYRLPDGKVVQGYYIEQIVDRRARRAYEFNHPSLPGLRTGPFDSITQGQKLSVLYDPTGHAYARNADANGSQTTSMVRLVLVGAAWVVVELTCLLALVRRRSLAQRLGKEADAEAAGQPEA
ncbi:hypothetical protein [Oryzihumus sp.]|uniref:hypothetical protein n=1 Tax=Oryzihumus sp. TaxID=1968903 RepID=UPI002EDA7D03